MQEDQTCLSIKKVLLILLQPNQTLGVETDKLWHFLPPKKIDKHLLEEVAESVHNLTITGVAQ